jgi:hypothetical protein
MISDVKTTIENVQEVREDIVKFYLQFAADTINPYNKHSAKRARKNLILLAKLGKKYRDLTIPLSKVKTSQLEEVKKSISEQQKTTPITK